MLVTCSIYRAPCAFVLLGLVFSTNFAVAYRHGGNVQIKPQQYESEPQFTFNTAQRVSNTEADRPWLVDFHVELEILNSRIQNSTPFAKGDLDRSLDIDRGWIRSPLGDLEWGEITVGRIHPWEVSLNPNALDPWGLAGSYQGQNRGIALGADLTDRVFPSPILLGWIGVHYWSDPIALRPFQWGVTISPIFIPTLGSAFDFDTVSSPGRRQFAGQRFKVMTEHGEMPVRFESVEPKNILINPQLMAQAYWDLNSVTEGLENWAWISNAPESDPSPGAILRYEELGGTRYAVTKPEFPRRWTAGNTLLWTPQRIGRYFRNYAFFSTVLAQDDSRLAWEVGAQNQFIRLSYLNEFNRNAVRAAGAYTDQLIQYQGQYPLGDFTPYWGAKHHLHFKDAWFRTGVRARLVRNTTLELGTDIFVASDQSYFSPWQYNDRVFAAFSWDIGP